MSQLFNKMKLIMKRSLGETTCIDRFMGTSEAVRAENQQVRTKDGGNFNETVAAGILKLDSQSKI